MKRGNTARARYHEGRIRFLESAARPLLPPRWLLAPPVHLDPEVLVFLTARAAARGIPLNDLVNALLKKDMELIEAAE
jgi:hypothetical protein